MTEYRYKELTEDDLRRLEPGAEIYTRDDPDFEWFGPHTFRRYEEARALPVRTSECGWLYAATREPVEPEQVITMDREWQTKDKRKFRVYCTDAPGPYPVHGCTEGEHHPTSRTINGRIGLCDNKHDLIPAPDWREQIPWSALADWVQWVTQDKDGTIRFHKSHPTPSPSHTGWMFSSGACAPSILRRIDWPSDWREAIAERPKGDGGGV